MRTVNDSELLETFRQAASVSAAAIDHMVGGGTLEDIDAAELMESLRNLGLMMQEHRSRLEAVPYDEWERSLSTVALMPSFHKCYKFMPVVWPMLQPGFWMAVEVAHALGYLRGREEGRMERAVNAGKDQ